MNLFISIFIYLISSIYTYNLDIRSSIIKTGPPNSYFGYSVALHRQQGGERNLIIGAPLADTNIPQSGAVYKCNADSRQTGCSQIFLDRQGERRDPHTNEKIEQKSGQWLGASIATSPSGSLIACAPRYVDFSVNLKRRQPTGLCYLLKNLLPNEDPIEFTPCKVETEWGHHRIGFCQAGFSSTISGSNNYIVGAPGSYYWQGQVYSYDILTKTTIATNDTGKSTDDQYKGYSIASGRFSRNSDGSDIAVGLPKAKKDMSGLVTILNSKMKVIGNLEGERLGSYFGYSITALDLNGDGLLDLAVGAPMYSELSNNLEYEQGRVYVFYQLEYGFFTSPKVLNGFKSKSRFGHALASLGDTLKKGIDTLAVGAPYDGIDGRGVVYIYTGDQHGVIDKPIQKIEAEDFNLDLRTFGFSISGNVDMNEDEYPDLIIGAYESDAAVFLKSRPIINVAYDFTINPQNISLENRNRCKDSRGRDVPCLLQIQFCLGFSGGKYISEKLSFTYNITLDADHDNQPRMSFKDDENPTKRLDLDKNKSLRCHLYQAFIHEDIRDKLNPIRIDIQYDLLNNQQKSSKELLPIFNITTNTHLSKNIHILKNCGSDNVCIPDLRLTVTKNMDNYVVGTNDKFTLNIVVQNFGEDAFESMLYLEIPEDINIVHVKTDVQHQELTKNKYGFSRIDFDLGNPLPARQKVEISIDFSAKETLTSSTSTYNFAFNVTSSNAESSTTLNDNYLEIKVPLRVDVQLEGSGSSYVNGEKKPLMHNVTTKLVPISSKPIYPKIKHSYFLKNKGPSTVKELQLTILWPERTEDRQNNLFELISQPKICLTDSTNRAKASCDHLDLNVELEIPVTKCKTNNFVEAQSHTVDESVNYDAGYFKPLLRRSKRDVITANYEDEMCDEERCRKIICIVKDMSTNTELNVEVLATPHNQTLREIGQSEFPVTSFLIARIKKLQYNVDPSFLTPTLINATTEVNLIDLNSLKPIPLWIIILAVCFGLFILFLIILCLYSFGFFKRNRPPVYSDTQPLHNDDYSYRKGNRF